MADMVKKYCPEIHPFFVQGHRAHSRLYVNGKVELMSQRGVRQGDPCAPLYFSLALRPMLEHLEKRLRQLLKEKLPEVELKIILLAYWMTLQCSSRQSLLVRPTLL